jgi:two-component system sensor histidine kinase KdpD
MPEERRDPDKRPSPEALLEVARQEEGRHGKLRVFVGAAPGVGKTYAMLETARARKRDGYDIVVGVVETHGRKETQALLGGLEVVPRQRVEYKGRWLEEMDLDAIIARHPQIVLVDELAHTNASGSRHPKRYLDVEELLQQGIDVYTTVNIQHFESLNDVIAQITRVRVRETVPDSVFDRADAVELVDITPDDLIQRLKEGKVYIPKQAERALEHFFSPANLTALRELALRRTAERVDEQLRTQMQARAIQGPWAAGERILICVSEDPRAAGLVRYAKRLADRLHAPWTALYVEGRRSAQLTEVERDRIADTLRLAQTLGGEPVTIPGGDLRIADDVIGYAQANNATHVIIGKTSRTRWFEILHGSVVHDLVRRAGSISVHVIAGEAVEGEPIPKKTVRAAVKPPSFEPRAYAAALLTVAAAVGAGELFWRWIRIENVDLLFLLAVVGIAVRFGLWPSLFASVVSGLCYNFFFTVPYHTFEIAYPAHVVAVVFFTVVALVVSNVAASARVQAVAAMARARTTESLYALAASLPASARSTTCCGQLLTRPL